ncbi:hypothetical protein TARUN_2862 [Trichoderma arundinaceum]|uniref:Myb-like domain-containing protein n=1 Tax=Trichoderma arundinaceum TaxID=490622 RepID=A0A395NUB3_TRIAR|nr:hypothetical protein TARUN_2862 [Trichoderma arundinaceum]
MKNDIVRRHDQGVTKNRKTVLTGGGRAWSEDEEAYLVQTRLQKMPYKHIAAHLKKTELACRLHYHQLSHNSGRRKRASSVSSVSDRSPDMSAAIPSSVHGRHAGPISSHRRAESYSSTSTSSSVADVHLPRIMDSCASPTRLPSILPKPMAMSGSLSNGFNSRYLPRMHEELAHLSHAPFQSHGYHHSTPPPPPRMERLSLSLPSTSAHTPAHVDLSRLQAIYDAHRDAFWNAIASEYGSNASPAQLETAWKTGACCRGPPPLIRPITPAASPEAEVRRYSMDRTSIPSILTAEEAPNGRW